MKDTIRTALISFLANSINIRALSSYLKGNGYEVTCLFCPGSFNELNLRKLVALLKGKKISLVGISLVTDDFAKAVSVTQAVKENLGVPVIWGGAHVNVRPEESLRHADMICRGEGEDALLELVKSMSMDAGQDTTIRNIWFKTETGIIRNDIRNLEENLDRYPFPDFDLDSQYVMSEDGVERLSENHLMGEYSIMTSRGCPYQCHYCYNSYRREQYRGKGKYLRSRSVENVIKELALAKTMFPHIKGINFWDDSFVARKLSDFVEFKPLYLQEIHLPFFALVEPMALDYEKIKLLKESGLCSLQVGIQTGSERVNREVYHRAISNSRVVEIAHFLHDLEIEVTYDIIFNNPYETLDDLRETINLLLQFPKPFSLQGYNLVFYPGAAITKRALADGFISLKPDTDDFSTIEGKSDSPVAMRGKAVVSNRFYSIDYDSSEKEYLNALISLMAYRHISRRVVRFFFELEKPYKTALLTMFFLLYSIGARIKNGLGIKL